MRELLKRRIPNITEEACDKFVAYYELLIDWNTRMNLTAITEPDEVVGKHFIDSLQKRVTFLNEVCKTLGLRAECVHARAEDFGRDPNRRASFDAVLSRAVASLPTLLELTVPLLRVGGKAYCYKGDVGEELKSAKSALHLLHCSAEVVPVEADYGARTLVICTKNAPTPAAYPRKAGMPSKKPL